MPRTSALTHAGGVVYRLRSGRPEFLLVTARRRPDVWVYPKGHIESGETPQETAVREVEEEAGVRANVVKRIDDVSLDVRGEQQRIRYFLMTAFEETDHDEGRQVAWLSARAAKDRLLFPEARSTLRKAVDALGEQESK
jgi:8-oxo-dGTP pyrophosphatase MutT (NUDIX family)